jgi:hypothetical protein
MSNFLSLFENSGENTFIRFEDEKLGHICLKMYFLEQPMRLLEVLATWHVGGGVNDRT